GFILSDHADWPGLLRTISDTGAERVVASHGSAQILTRYLQERGLDTDVMTTSPWDESEDVQE
ncbi:MAG: DNA ligase-associated DEXH box helicase, partial [Deltaproteobacteria bacterium]|nr:DNA ligase-associated DEXH box helicase [Deltaproteobacteria bacterium]